MSGLTKAFISTLPRNLFRVFWGRNLLFHLTAIGLTWISVSSGLDWLYFEATRPLARYMFQAVFAGWLVPVAFPILAYAVGAVFGLRRARWAAFSVAQAVVVGLLVSSFYKALTGRPSPNHPLARVVEASREFRFGLLRGGVFFGWPSSHTAVAFSMASALWTLYPDSKVMRCAALLYAFYVGVGVSMTIHWFSDFVAGAILGIAIGITVGKSFRDIAVSSGFPNEKCNM